jgi:hypothetical protein
MKTRLAMMPVEEYLALLAKAGYTSTPKLDSDIVRARSRFKKGKTIPWKIVKRELKLI